MKTGFAILASAALVLGAPLQAQEKNETAPADEMAAMGELFGSMFGEAEPLTAEQEARLPAAEGIVEKIFPDGSFALLMEASMEPMMDGVLGQVMDVPFADLSALSGVPESEVMMMGEASLGEIMAIVDPAFDQRSDQITQVTVGMITRVMDRIEPSYQAGLARAYATRFTQTEMADIQTFFATPSGSHYAAESMLVYADPQVMAAMNEMMPAIFEILPEMMTEMAAVQASLPQPRTFDQLSASEQAQLAELFGSDVDVMAANAAAIAEADAAAK